MLALTKNTKAMLLRIAGSPRQVLSGGKKLKEADQTTLRVLIATGYVHESRPPMGYPLYVLTEKGHRLVQGLS